MWKKDKDYTSLGYQVFRIPYFIQITTKVLEAIFKEHIPFKQRYQNGFIDAKAILPANYCELGIKNFIKDLETFSYHSEEIIKSLKDKIKEVGDPELVVPFSIINLIQ